MGEKNYPERAVAALSRAQQPQITWYTGREDERHDDRDRDRAEAAETARDTNTQDAVLGCGRLCSSSVTAGPGIGCLAWWCLSSARPSSSAPQTMTGKGATVASWLGEGRRCRRGRAERAAGGQADRQEHDTRPDGHGCDQPGGRGGLALQQTLVRVGSLAERWDATQFGMHPGRGHQCLGFAAGAGGPAEHHLGCSSGTLASGGPAGEQRRSRNSCAIGSSGFARFLASAKPAGPAAAGARSCPPGAVRSGPSSVVASAVTGGESIACQPFRARRERATLRPRIGRGHHCAPIMK